MPPQRILIRIPNWLGDLLLARPLLHALRRTFAAAEVRAVGPPDLLRLVSEERVFELGMPWPQHPLAPEPRRRARAALIAELRGWRPDLVMVLPPSFSSAWFAWRTGARVRVGYRQEARGPLLTHALPRPERGEQHLSREYLDLGTVVGTIEVPLPSLALSPEAVTACAALRLTSSRNLALLGPGAAYGPAKRWPGERFAALGRRLAEKGWAVLVCGSPSERAVCEGVAQQVGPQARSVAGMTSLEVQAALCAEAGLVVSNDSGLAHLAGAVGAATVVLFGSTSSAWSAPLGARVRVVQHPPVCAPCFQRTCAIGYACQTAIEVEEVAAVCSELAA